LDEYVNSIWAKAGLENFWWPALPSE